MKKLITVVLCLLVAGCARLKVGDLEYWRVGSQTVKAELIDPNGLTIKIDQASKTNITIEIPGLGKGVVE